MSDPNAAGPSSAQPPTVAPKRPAPPSDLTEPSDKKSRTSVKPASNEPDARQYSKPGGIMNLMVNRFSTPFPTLDAQFVTVDTTHMSGWFTTIRDALLEAIYPDSRFEPANVISQAQFVLVCRYLAKSRVDHIYASYSGRRPGHRIAIPREFEVPKCLADVLAGIGTVLVQNGAMLVCPQPEGVPEDNALRLNVQVTYAMLTAFSSLVQAAKVRGYIRTSVISTVVEGTGWWLLTARTTQNATVIANNSDSAQVFGVFKEWGPADGVLAALVQNQFNGLIGGDTSLKWSMDFVTGIPGLRRSFNLDA